MDNCWKATEGPSNQRPRGSRPGRCARSGSRVRPRARTIAIRIGRWDSTRGARSSRWTRAAAARPENVTTSVRASQLQSPRRAAASARFNRSVSQSVESRSLTPTPSSLDRPNASQQVSPASIRRRIHAPRARSFGKHLSLTRRPPVPVRERSAGGRSIRRGSGRERSANRAHAAVPGVAEVLADATADQALWYLADEGPAGADWRCH